MKVKKICTIHNSKLSRHSCIYADMLMFMALQSMHIPYERLRSGFSMHIWWPIKLISDQLRYWSEIISIIVFPSPISDWSSIKSPIKLMAEHWRIKSDNWRPKTQPAQKLLVRVKFTSNPYSYVCELWTADIEIHANSCLLELVYGNPYSVWLVLVFMWTQPNAGLPQKWAVKTGMYMCITAKNGSDSFYLDIDITVNAYKGHLVHWS